MRTSLNHLQSLHCFTLFILFSGCRFVETHGLQILELNLYRNFTAHLTTLKQFNIIGVNTLLRNVSNVRLLPTFAFFLNNKSLE